MVPKPFDLTRTTLAVLSIVGLIAVSFLVVRPFLAATVWAATLVVATWPYHATRCSRALAVVAGLAVTLMTFASASPCAASAFDGYQLDRQLRQPSY